MQEPPSDTMIIAQLRDGNDAGFDEIMRRYKQPVLNFAYRILGNAADAEDVAQDVFVRVYRHAGDFDPSRSFSTWLFGIARNAALDRLRNRHCHPTEPLGKMNEPVGSSSDAPYHQAVMKEVGEQIAIAVGSLPEDQRTALVLSEYHDLSYAEIADIMRCSEKAVESRLYRAKRALRVTLKHLLD